MGSAFRDPLAGCGIVSATVGLFDSEDKRIAAHRELIEATKATLSTLGVTARQGEKIVEPQWKDPKSVPLEFRWWLPDQVENLVFHAFDPKAQAKIGDSTFIAELAETLAAVRGYVAGPTPPAVARFRVEAFRKLQEPFVKAVDRAKTSADPARRFTVDLIAELVPDVRTAVSWFSTEQGFATALALWHRGGGSRHGPRPDWQAMTTALTEAAPLLVGHRVDADPPSAAPPTPAPVEGAERRGFCSQCGTSVRPADRFCRQCGSSLN